MPDPAHLHCPACAQPYTPLSAAPLTWAGGIRECVCGAVVQYAGDSTDNAAVLFELVPFLHGSGATIPHCRRCHTDIGATAEGRNTYARTELVPAHTNGASPPAARIRHTGGVDV